MSTNPYTLAMPGGPTGAVVVDFATSTIAQGKLLAASQTGVPLPPGMILDRAGRSATTAADYSARAVPPPAAGPTGHGLGLTLARGPPRSGVSAGGRREGRARGARAERAERAGGRHTHSIEFGPPGGETRTFNTSRPRGGDAHIQHDPGT